MNTVQLANTYNPSKNYGVDFWYVSPKFDGVRAIFIPELGFLTRHNKPITGFNNMAKVLEKICKVCRLSFVDGELTVAGKTFQTAQSVILASEHPDKSKVEFHVFAVGGDFADTATMLKNLPHNPKAGIFRVNSELIPNSFQAVEQACEKFTARGYEGVMLRNPIISYFNGRNDYLLKYKFFNEADLSIVEVHEGKGKFAGTLGSVTVKGKINGLNVVVNVSAGLSDEDRHVLFDDKNLIGKFLSVKFQSLTDKPNGEGFYSLRFPSAIGVKEDREFSTEAVCVQPNIENFSTPSNVVYKKNGIVEASFQVSFSQSVQRMSFIPTKTEMSAWKQQLYKCKSIDEGKRLVADLKLTIPQIREFARYLGVNLCGCKYLKSEIVRWLINASLGAKLRAEALLKIIKAKREVSLSQCYVIRVSGKLKSSTIPMKSINCSKNGGNFLNFTRMNTELCSFLDVIHTSQSRIYGTIINVKGQYES